jgi:hypothetical protein
MGRVSAEDHQVVEAWNAPGRFRLGGHPDGAVFAPPALSNEVIIGL